MPDTLQLVDPWGHSWRGSSGLCHSPACWPSCALICVSFSLIRPSGDRVHAFPAPLLSLTRAHSGPDVSCVEAVVHTVDLTCCPQTTTSPWRGMHRCRRSRPRSLQCQTGVQPGAPSCGEGGRRVVSCPTCYACACRSALGLTWALGRETGSGPAAPGDSGAAPGAQSRQATFEYPYQAWDGNLMAHGVSDAGG